MALFPVEKMNLIMLNCHVFMFPTTITIAAAAATSTTTAAAATANATTTAGNATGVIANSTANATATATAATTIITSTAAVSAITTTTTTTTRAAIATVFAPATTYATRKRKARDITMQAIYRLQIQEVSVTFSSTDPQVATATISMAQRRTVGTRSENNRCFNRSWIILNNEQRTSYLNGWSKQRSVMK